MKRTKKVLSLLLAILTVMSVFAVTAIPASAANYSSTPTAFNQPESNDFARWNGSKMVKGSGTTKAEVQWIQAALNFAIKNLGLKANLLDVDGNFGPESRKAALAFQKAYGLAQDGSFGPACIAKMKSILATPAQPSNAKSKTLSINWSLIKATGKQKAGTQYCLCYALAYSRDIIDNTAHNMTEYSEGYLKSAKRYSFTAVCTKADYNKKATASSADLYKIIYDNINNGKPVIINVKDGRSSGCHYVAVVGYVNITDPAKATLSNFLIIDSVGASYKTETLAEVGYTLRKENSKYKYYVD